MSINRVQKLLFTEYCDFDDMVLIESPFAQTTRDGKGIRQVHLGNVSTRNISPPQRSLFGRRTDSNEARVGH